MIRRRLAVAALLVAAPVLAGCSDEPSPDRPAETSTAPVEPTEPTEPTEEAAPTGPATGPAYVALGDSYSAAPGVPDTSGADGCFRSSGNYAQAVAEASGLTITDVTCSGATSESVLQEQVPEITAQAELVTLGVGGNDFDLFARLIQGCIDAAGPDASGSPCTDQLGDEVAGALPQIALNVGGILDAIDERAPDAQVVVVGYPQLLPDSGTCPDLIPLAGGDYALVNEVTRGLSDALREEAEERGHDFVDLIGPSQGHDICSAEPWVNGIQVGEDGTAPLHPFAVEQQAVAAMITSFL